MKRSELIYGQELELDPQLEPFLRAASEAEAREQLGILIESVTPLIKQIVKQNIGYDKDECEDACQDVIKSLVDHLWKLREGKGARPISNFRGFVKKAAKNKCADRLRAKKPLRRWLKEDLGDVLRDDSRLASWRVESNKNLCGLAVWRDRPELPTSSERLAQLLRDPGACEDELLPSRAAQVTEHAELLRAVFTWVDHPIELDQVVGIVFALKRYAEIAWASETEEAEDGEPRSLIESIPSSSPPPDEEAATKEFLRQLWAEVEQLRPLQRIAYLLNFTAADGDVWLFVKHEVASVERIGRTLQLTDEHFTRAWEALKLDAASLCPGERTASFDGNFEELWEHLPRINDSVIAAMLGRTPEQVNNLRQAAARRLGRRMKSWREGNKC